MKYMLLIYGDEQVLNQQEREDCFAESAQYARQLQETGNFVDASPLQLIETAHSVQVRNGQRLVTDGPFAETREQLGGYFIVEAESMEQAIGFAANIPGARWGTVEVRPLIDLSTLLT